MDDQLPEGQMIFSLREVKDHAKVTTWTLRRWIKGGDLRAHKVGKHWRVRREELLRLIGITEGHRDPAQIMVLPDEEDSERRRWSGHVRGEVVTQFMKMQLVMLTLDDKNRADRVAMLHEFTTTELNQYHHALAELQTMTQEVIEERHVEGHPDTTETPL